MKSILDLSNKEARSYFLEPDSYCTIPLPEYFSFKSILDYVKKHIGNRSYKSLLKDNSIHPSYYDGVNYNMLSIKDNKYSYRPLQIINPYLYYLLVREITESSNWKRIVERFSYFKCNKIEVSSIPKPKEKKSKTATSINTWWKNYEQRSIELSLEYKYMVITDITNCYGSIYTHTVDWAIEGKDIAKRNSRVAHTPKTLGHTLDTYIQDMQYGQTNGIPQGSVLSDFISEIILGYADKELFTKIANISDYRILRYRDDYRIFSNSKENAELILKELTLVLAELNFHINPAKTILSENIVENAIKKDKFYYISNIPILQKDNTKDEENEISMISNIKDELYYILAFSKQFPNSPSLVKMMLNVAKRLAKVENVNRPVVLIAIITEILVGNPKVYQQAIASLSLLIDQISEIDERTNLINQIYKKLSVLPNIGHIQVWLQRIADIDYSEPLCKIAKGEPVQIWNFEWLKDEFHKGLPLAMIVDIEKKNSMQPIIGIEEIDVFGY